MNVTTTKPFVEFQNGITEAVAELDKLARYCRDTMIINPWHDPEQARAARRLIINPWHDPEQARAARRLKRLAKVEANMVNVHEAD